jgi:hypothetical protein
MTPEGTFNFIESLVWFAVALTFLFNVKGKKISANQRLSWLLGGLFVVFGISDLIEIKTGGWWKPWWLFLLKAVCLIGIIISMFFIFKERRKNNTFRKLRANKF